MCQEILTKFLRINLWRLKTWTTTILRLRAAGKLFQVMVIKSATLSKMFAALALCCLRMTILSTLCL